MSLPTIIIGALAGKAILTSYGMKEAGKADRRAAESRMQAAEFEAKLMEQRSGQEIAFAQHQAQEEKRVAGLVASRALAVAAASGGGASDVTVVNLISKIKGEGAYRAGIRLYEGESRARSLRLAASAKRYEGATGVIESARGQKVANTMAFGNTLMAVGSLYGKYGGGNTGIGYGSAGSADASAGGTFNSGAW